MDVEFAHIGKGIEGSKEVVSKIHCGHTGRSWESLQHGQDYDTYKSS